MLANYIVSEEISLLEQAKAAFAQRYPQLLSQLWQEGIRYTVTAASPEQLYAQLMFERGADEPALVVNLAADGSVNIHGQALSQLTLARHLAMQLHEWDAPARSGQWNTQHRLLTTLPGVLLLSGVAAVLIACFWGKPAAAGGWGLWAAAAGAVSVMAGSAVHFYADYQRSQATRQGLGLGKSRFNWQS